jgi:TolB-like protein/DNA-binding winged helix-turn-helix (wHTH) protein/Flp pilus assembly protein TadD
MHEAGIHRRVRFGVFEVDLRSGELRKGGSKVRLQAQPFQVLALLLERRGDTVTRDEIRNQLWGAGTFVDFDHGLNKAINKIRETLGDSAVSPRFIETVARRGYRFIADVTMAEDVPAATAGLPADDLVPENQQPQYPALPAHPADPARSSRWPTSTLAGLALTLTALVLVVWGFESRGRSSSPIRSLAVLPLENLSGDASQEYFADGMTDELIATLGQITTVRVISRTSVMPYKRVRKPLPEIARELNVDAVVEGTVMRSGGQVRITAQLIEALADKHVWSESYQGDLRDALTLQHRVALAIARQVQVNVNPKEQVARKNERAVDPDAREAYLKGRYFWNKRTADGLKTAQEYFDLAVAKDPNYAQAYSGLADTYALLGDWQYAVMPPEAALPRAKAAALKALELDDQLGEAHTSLAFCLDGFDWNFESAEREFRKGVELNPSYATAHHWYAWHLILVGRDREALAEMRQAESLDPLSLIINADLAELLLIAHLPDESIQQSRKTIQMDSNFSLAHNQLGQAYLQKGLNDEAIVELQQAARSSRGSATATANLARAYAVSGRREEAVHLLSDLKSRSKPGASNASEIAAIYAALGDRDQGMTWLERGYDERFNPGVLLRPGLDPLRADRRFQALERRVGLSR